MGVLNLAWVLEMCPQLSLLPTHIKLIAVHTLAHTNTYTHAHTHGGTKLATLKISTFAFRSDELFPSLFECDFPHCATQIYFLPENDCQKKGSVWAEAVYSLKPKTLAKHYGKAIECHTHPFWVEPHVFVNIGMNFSEWHFSSWIHHSQVSALYKPTKGLWSVCFESLMR